MGSSLISCCKQSRDAANIIAKTGRLHASYGNLCDNYTRGAAYRLIPTSDSG